MLGYNDVSVLDISKNAIERSKQRLGNRANGVQWIEADIRAFKPTRTYGFGMTVRYFIFSQMKMT